MAEGRLPIAKRRLVAYPMSVRSPDALAKIAAVHLDLATHLVQARAHALPDAVAKGLVTSSSGCKAAALRSTARRRQIGKIGSNDGRPLIVVAGIQDVAHCLPNPFRRLDGSQFVEHQHFCFKYRLQDLKLRSLDGGIVGVLNFLQQLAIVVEQTCRALLHYQFAQNAHSQMRLPYPNGAKQHQAGGLERVLFDEAIGLEQRIGELASCAGKIGVEIRQRAMLIPRWNARFLEQPLGPIAGAAVAADYALGLFPSSRHCLPAGAATLRTWFAGHRTRLCTSAKKRDKRDFLMCGIHGATRTAHPRHYPMTDISFF